MALKERLAEIDTGLGDIREVIQEALDEEFEEEYTVREVRITPADLISVLIDLTGPGETEKQF
jgi:hypothetical protein